jgi:DNA-binding MarR family transcriptional regulator
MMDDFHGMPGHLIRRAHQIAVAIFMDECGAQHLTPVQFACLSGVRSQPGIDATRLAALVAFDRSTLGNVLERLEAKNWVARSPSPEDRRIKILHITPEGEALLDGVAARVEATQERILAPLDAADRATFMRLLVKLVDVNNEASRAPLGGRSEAE